jgi:hypothetical protein
MGGPLAPARGNASGRPPRGGGRQAPRAAGLQILADLVKEAEANSTYETRGRLVTRASYGHHYRRVVPALLEALHFRCNNDVQRPVMQALEVLER